MSYKRTTVTAALPYANGGIHIGHLAGVYIPADIYVRYLRQRQRSVLFVCGTDEHGVPVTIRAKQEGVSVQEIVDRYHALIRDSFAEFGISFDVFSRTTSPTHRAFAADFFRTLYDHGQLVAATEEQYCDADTGEFLTDRNIVGICPKCGAPGAYGDQCEACGTTLSPDELINPTNKNNPGHALVKKATTNWYLPLGNYQAWLREWILKGHTEWRPNVYGQCKSWLDMDLQPRAMTRDLDWGIPVPIAGAEGKVLYVWFDAPIGYISNTKELCARDSAWGTWQQWWQDPETRLIHFIGKDNIVFHCLIFPVMLHAHGGYILPDNVPANEFLNLENDKISTSHGWAVWLHDYLEAFPGKQDVLRYVLTATAPETKDNNFTWKEFQERNNSELVAIYGNFVNRALQLTKKYFACRVPDSGTLTAAEEEVLNTIRSTRATVEELLETFKFRDALREMMNLARCGNRYITECEPWKIWSSDPARVGTILYTSLQLVAALALLFEPFLPFSSKTLRAMLRLPEDKAWDSVGNDELLPPGHLMDSPQLLFEKIDDDAIAAQIEKLNATKAETHTAAAPAFKDVVPFDTFEKIDLRVGTVTACERIPKSKKLLKLHINDGTPAGRTILSGIAQHYPDPQTLVGQQVLFVANFAPRTMMGQESEGMILSAVDSDGTLAVVTPTKPTTPGSIVS